MSDFARRAITVQLIKYEGTIDGTKSSIDLSGYRCEVQVINQGAEVNLGHLELRIWGMNLSDMNAFATKWKSAIATKMDMVRVSAGDEGSQPTLIFEGNIYSAFIDYGNAPEIFLNIEASAAYVYRLKTAAPNSFKGSTDVAQIIKALAAAIGYSFVNSTTSPVNIKLTDLYLSGTIIEQIYTVAKAAKIACSIHKGVVSIWANGAAKDDLVIQVSPQTNMVGYPFYTQTGIGIKTIFMPDIENGRKVTVSGSIVDKVNGNWYVQTVNHDLSTYAPNGPWFSNTLLTIEGLYVPNN